MLETIVEEVKIMLEERKFSKLKKYLEDLNSADIPCLFEELKDEQIIVVYRLLAKDVAAEAFVELDSDLQEKLIGYLTDKELKGVLDELFMDDTVDLIEEMPANVVKRLLKHINKEDRNIINELLKYPDDSAGSLMTIEFVDLKENMLVEDALKEIKKDCINKETIYHCYVLSNYPRTSYENTKSERTYEEFMDGVLYSYQVQMVKPEAEIYQMLLRKYELIPGECVFLDDNLANVEAAKKLGIHAIQFITKAETERELRELGVQC